LQTECELVKQDLACKDFNTARTLVGKKGVQARVFTRRSEKFQGC
jgi:hypothetical protein